ncbi:MAG: proline dehydrogenase family protein, partial [Planctomycetota bacterium]
MDDEPGNKFTIAMADEVLRLRRPERAAKRMDSLVADYGVPKYFSGFDQYGLSIGNFLAGLAPRFVMPFVKAKVRKDSEHVIIAGEKTAFSKYLRGREEAQIRVNFNQLGEAVLGDVEARKRLDQYLKRLIKPGIDYCSVKLSSVVSQISLTGYESTLDAVKEQLRVLYRAAIEGGKPGKPKFVNLDMEEYRDLHLTVDTFKSVLDEAEFENLVAGIVLQAYLPDSYCVLQSLTDWARDRYLRTGAGIKIRLVKGANLAMEQVEASLHDWEQAPYYNKLDVDANYKRMLEFATRPENQKFMKVGLASHNLFDVAYALLVRERRGTGEQLEFEMLEGMANAQALEVRERTGDLVVYTPVCFQHDFESAVAYLVRRLDENTAPGSFLGALFALEEGSPDWNEQKDAFLQACERAKAPSLSSSPNRKQNRLIEMSVVTEPNQPFHNEPDTDFSLPENRDWLNQIVFNWKNEEITTIP